MLVALFIGSGCAGVKERAQTGTGGSNTTGSGGSFTGAGGTGVVIVPETCNGKCTDFPSTPYIPVGLPSDVAGRFGTPSGSGTLRDRARGRYAVPEQLAPAEGSSPGVDRLSQGHLSRRQGGERFRRLHER